jgi:hypothetical protein
MFALTGTCQSLSADFSKEARREVQGPRGSVAGRLSLC